MASLLTTGYVWLRGQLVTQAGGVVTATIYPADDLRDSFSAEVIARAIVGAQEFGEADDEVRVLQTTISLLRSVFTAEGITDPPTKATVDVHGLSKWAIDMATTRWGKVVVVLGLVKVTQLNEWQGRRATI